MNEKILRIEEGIFKIIEEEEYGEYSGFLIITDKQTIKFGISNSTNCCEDWGYIISNDDISDFIGAEILSIKLVDKELKTKAITKLRDNYVEEHECIFVNIETTKGLLQLTVYNSHNGYYGHNVTLISNQCLLLDCLL